MERRLLPTCLAVLLAACGGSAGSPGDPGSNGPYSVQPQPIPDDGDAESIDASSLTAATSSDGIVLGGLATNGNPSGAPSSGIEIRALDLTTPGAIVATTTDASGSFTLDLPGAVLGDRVLLFSPTEGPLDAAFEVNTTTPAAATAPCLLADGSTGLYFKDLPVGEVGALSLTFSAQYCGAGFAVDGLRVAGDALVIAPLPAAGFSVPVSGTSASASFLLEPTAASSFVSFVILAAGAERHVIALTGTSVAP